MNQHLNNDDDKLDKKKLNYGSIYHRWAENLVQPYVAPRLLYLLAFLLILFLFGWIVFYWVAKASQEISIHRRQMNKSYVAIHDFFERNEQWLSNLRNATGNEQESPRKRNDLSQLTILQDTDNDGSVFVRMSKSNQDLLNYWSANLLYVDSNLKQVRLLHQSSKEKQQALPDSIWPFLNAKQVYGLDNSNHILWYSPKNDKLSRIYIFTALDIRDRNNSRWIGMQLKADQMQAVLQKTLHDGDGGYILRTKNGDLLFGSGAYYQQALAAKIPFEENNVSFGGINRFITLKLSVNANNWTITQYIDLYAVLSKALRREIIFGLLIQIIVSSLLLLIAREVNRRVLLPAQLQSERIVESEAFSSAIIDTAPVGICVIRHGGAEVVLENQLARQLLNQAEQNTSATYRPELLKAYRKRAKNSDSFELPLDNDRHVLIAFANTRYQGSPVLLCTLSDISVRKQTEAALANAKKDSDAANKAKSLFLATMSHEIRTPLYGVLGTLELLALSELDAEQRLHLETMQASSNTLLQLINDVLDLSKIEAGQMTIECAEFDPIVLVETVLRIYAPVAQRKKLNLYCCIDSNLPLQLYGDPLRLQQILGNLLSNAVKFTDSGNVVVRVDLVSIQDGCVMVALQVSDSGIGILESEQKRLFEPFSQVGKNALQRFGGTGLGLSICRQLTELMGGSINVTSKSRIGSSFIANIPLSLAKAKTSNPLPTLANKPVYLYSHIAEICESLSGWINLCGAQAITLISISELHGMVIPPGAVLVQVSGHPEKLLPSTLSGYIYIGLDKQLSLHESDFTVYVPAYNLRALLKLIMRKQGGLVSTGVHHSASNLPHGQYSLNILLAEDHPINQMLLKSQLEILGCTVTVAKDGEYALGLWQDDKFDVVLTDVNMPNMDGYQLARTLRDIGVHVPIIGVTANVLREEIERCYASGMSSHLAKPVSLDGLEQMLREVAQGKNKAHGYI